MAPGLESIAGLALLLMSNAPETKEIVFCTLHFLYSALLCWVVEDTKHQPI
jgi:hypothetical protein